MDIYVYYKVRTELAGVLMSRVSDMQTDLSRKSGVAAALKRRPAAKDGYHTWMEVYLAVPDGFEAMLEQAVTTAQVAPLINEERHTEYFLDCSSCA